MCEQTIERHVVAPHPQEILHHYLFLHFSPKKTHLSRNLSCSVLSLLLHMDGVAQHSCCSPPGSHAQGAARAPMLVVRALLSAGSHGQGLLRVRACTPLLAMERPWMQDLVGGMGCRSCG
jgi:hypothetical protein